MAEIVDQREARFYLRIAEPRMRHQGMVFGVDVGPSDPEHSRSLRHIDGARAGPTIGRANGHGSALPVFPDIIAGRGADPDFID